jgi:hypothetical protein
MIVAEIAFENAPQMPIINDNDVVQALAPDTADQPLHVTILPRTLSGDENLLNTHSFNSCRERMTIDSISIPNQIPWCAVLRKSFNDLLCGPDRGGVFGDIKMEEATTVLCQDYEDVQHA